MTITLRIGYELVYRCARDTPMIVMLTVHFSRAADLLAPDVMSISPAISADAYRDGFGNWCTRLVAPPGALRLYSTTLIRDSGQVDNVLPDARQVAVQDLPPETLTFLLGSRYCETDLMFDIAWELFRKTPAGWPRVQAISDYVHDHLVFGYEHARATRTAYQAYEQRVGVCRDFAHLAIALLRCMNIPARYCTGYLSDVGTPEPHAPMDFAAWVEVFLQGQWLTIDPRNNAPRAGRVLIARGRDAADVPISHSFGPTTLEHFTVWTDMQ